VSKQLFKSTAIVGSMTFLSRILGFVRDMLIARFFGVDASTDAFFVAFKIPDFLRRLFAEGAVSQAVIPVLTQYQQTNPHALKQFIDKAFGTFAVALVLITLIGVIAAPLLIALLAPGFTWHSLQQNLAVQLLRITLPYLFFISLVALSSAILNVKQKFAIPAITPIFLNLCIIGAVIGLAPTLPEPIFALAWAVLVAGLLQLFFQLAALKSLKLLPHFKIDFKNSGVRQVARFLLPAILASSLVQINVLLNAAFASFLIKGSVSWLYYADRLVEFPLGILGIAVATVILPKLSQDFATQDTKAFSYALDWGLRLVLLIAVPAALGLFLLAKPLISTLFQSDAFGVYDVQMTGKSLMAYATGLVGFVSIKVLVPGFTARQDMKTPMRFSIYAIIANIVLSLLLISAFAHTGLAIATSVGAYINALFLLFALIKEKIYQPTPHWRLFLSQLVFANGIMAVGLYYWTDTTAWYQWETTERIFHLGGAIMLAILVYLFSLLLVGFKPKQLLMIKQER